MAVVMALMGLRGIELGDVAAVGDILELVGEGRKKRGLGPRGLRRRGIQFAGVLGQKLLEPRRVGLLKLREVAQ